MKENILRKTKTALIIPFLLLGLTGCSVTATPESSTFFAMDTVMTVSAYGDKEVLNEAESLINRLDKELSVTDTESQIYALNSSKNAVLSEEAYTLLSRALYWCEETDGALDVSIYPVVKEWGFTTGDYKVPAESSLRELLKNVDYSDIILDPSDFTVTLNEGMEIDLGSVAKGYAGDRVLELLSENGIESALISLGGNIQALGSKPDGSLWRIAIADPADTDKYLGYLDISDKAVVTSGSYERFFEENGKVYHHIMDPETGYPADSGLLSVTVIGDSGLDCDALSTALFVMGPEKGLEFLKSRTDFDAVFVTDSGTVYITGGITDSFHLTSDSGYTVITGN